MQVILGILGSIVTILWIFHRLAEMGIDLGGLNPFYWRRRRAWRNRYEGDPIHAVDDPMEIAALVVTGVARIEGDITAEQKDLLLTEFGSTFSLGEREAKQLLGSCSHLLGAPQVVQSQLEGVLERHQKVFSKEQAESIAAMMHKVASITGEPTAEQKKLVADVRQKLGMEPSGDGVWA